MVLRVATLDPTPALEALRAAGHTVRDQSGSTTAAAS
jgi:hypothetical protein